MRRREGILRLLVVSWILAVMTGGLHTHEHDHGTDGRSIGVDRATAALLGGHVHGSSDDSVAVQSTDDDPPPVPRAECGPGSHPEEGRQGRVPASDWEGPEPRAHEGYWCNAELLGRFGPEEQGGAGLGGYKVHRHVDEAGRECAFYDTTLLFPANVPAQGTNLTGVHVLDMSDGPANMTKTANLLTPAMQSPHESLSYNAERGLLAAGMGNPITYPAWVDIYDVGKDCRNPVLRSSLPVGVLGHEGNFSPDGNTLYISSTGARSVTALDVSNPDVPVILWQGDFRFHGLTISDDGNRMYAADLGDPGLTILDTTQIQERVLNPQVKIVSQFTWDNVVSIPQQPIPVTIGGKSYLVEMDEFSRGTSTDPDAPVGAARIIKISDEENPEVVSDLRLEVHQRENRAEQMDDPGADSSLRGYAGHYCAVPTRDEPKIAACSFILSGLRVFDITDPDEPKEIAYYNPPGDASSYAMSAPAFVPERNEIWYSDGDKGFYAVQITNDAWPSG